MPPPNPHQITKHTAFLPPSVCSHLISLCAFPPPSTSTPTDYPQATHDLEICRHPGICEYLNEREVMARIGGVIHANFGQAPACYDDVFLIKYSTDHQKELISHVDAGDVSFMIALSEREAFEGGGTRFECIDETVQVRGGEDSGRGRGAKRGATRGRAKRPAENDPLETTGLEHAASSLVALNDRFRTLLGLLETRCEEPLLCSEERFPARELEATRAI